MSHDTSRATRTPLSARRPPTKTPGIRLTAWTTIALIVGTVSIGCAKAPEIVQSDRSGPLDLMHLGTVGVIAAETAYLDCYYRDWDCSGRPVEPIKTQDAANDISGDLRRLGVNASAIPPAQVSSVVPEPRAHDPQRCKASALTGQARAGRGAENAAATASLVARLGVDSMLVIEEQSGASPPQLGFSMGGSAPGRAHTEVTAVLYGCNGRKVWSGSAWTKHEDDAGPVEDVVDLLLKISPSKDASVRAARSQLVALMRASAQ